MSQRKKQSHDSSFFYTARKISTYGIVLRVGSITENAVTNKNHQQIYGVCLMDEKLDFIHRINLKYRQAKKVCDKWVLQ